MKVSPRKSLGVRGKLIGLLVGTAFVSLLLACTAFVVYDRRSYAEAKRSTLSVLVDSVAQSAFGPTAFQDPDSAAVILKVLDAEPSAQVGAIYTQEGNRLVAWQRPRTRLSLPERPPVVADGFHGDQLRVTRAIKNAEGTVGTLVVVFSAADIHARTVRFLMLAGGVLAVSVLLALVVATLAQRVITRPVRNLATAARRVQEHQDFDVRAERVSGDELGQLTDAFNEMLSMIQTRDRELEKHRVHLEDLVAQRTADLDRRNREMRLVMDHVDQGFITVDLDGVMAAERSAVVDRWFGAPRPGAHLRELVAAAPSFGEWFELGLGQVRDAVLPLELVLFQMPSRFEAGGKTFDVAYTGIGQGDDVERLLVIVTDVTEAIAREAAEREQRELVAMFQRIASDRPGVEEFLTEAAGLVGALRTERDETVQKRLIHTLKGNCAIYGLESYAGLAHGIETELAESGGGLDDGQRARLVAGWKDAMQRLGRLLGASRRDIVEIERAALEQFVSRLEAEMPRSELPAMAASWSHEPVARRFERLAQQASGLAERLGRPAPRVAIDDAGIRLADGWSALWSSMVHVVRNAIDHGIEPADQRLGAGKPASGALELRARRDGRSLVVSIHDDGRGIDWRRVEEKAAASGLPHRTHADLVEALFTDGLSTRSEASEVSGRGVGLGALRQAVHDLGGTVDVESTVGRGTTFRFVFEERTAATLAQTQPRSRSASLLPFVA